jgi:hypothetical protein
MSTSEPACRANPDHPGKLVAYWRQMSAITLAHLLGNQTQTDTLAFTDTKALTVYTIIAAPLSHVWYQVWSHGVQVAQTSSLGEAVSTYNVAEW